MRSEIKITRTEPKQDMQGSDYCMLYVTISDAQEKSQKTSARIDGVWAGLKTAQVRNVSQEHYRLSHPALLVTLLLGAFKTATSLAVGAVRAANVECHL